VQFQGVFWKNCKNALQIYRKFEISYLSQSRKQHLIPEKIQEIEDLPTSAVITNTDVFASPAQTSQQFVLGVQWEVQCSSTERASTTYTSG
jgi:hypothetical protein